jgi:inosine-uridine nucleoside N-ribohydrolase
MTPDETWKELFTKVENSDSAADQDVASELKNVHALFTASKAPAAEEILRLLRDNEPDTITIVAIGPLTNLALAAAMDPEAFLRVKEVVVMGGTLTEHGNVSTTVTVKCSDELMEIPQITPVAEFNTFADAVAAARVYALSSPNPKSTMPPSPPGSHTDGTPPPYLAPYPENLTRRLAVTLFPLDITHQHDLDRGQLRGASETLVKAQSPLAEWVTAFMVPTFRQIESLQQNVSGDAVGLTLHDPLCIWYCMAAESAAEWQLVRDEDIRVETSGQWTRGMCVVDKRTRKKREDSEEGERAGDTGNWLSMRSGNRLRRCVGTPQTAGKADFGDFLLKRVFAL